MGERLRIIVATTHDQYPYVTREVNVQFPWITHWFCLTWLPQPLLVGSLLLFAWLPPAAVQCLNFQLLPKMVKVRGRNNAIWMLGAVLGSLLVIHILWRHPTNGSIQVEEYFYTCRLEQRAKVPLDFGSTYLKPIPELQDLRNQSAVSVEKVRRMILENFSRKQNVRLDDVEDAIRKGRKGLRGLTEPNSCQKKSLKLLREDIGEQQDGVYTGHLSSLGYSAYFDGHSNGNSSALVKIIAAKSQRTALFCHVWFRSKKKEKRDLHIVHADVMNRTHLSR